MKKYKAENVLKSYFFFYFITTNKIKEMIR